MQLISKYSNADNIQNLLFCNFIHDLTDFFNRSIDKNIKSVIIIHNTLITQWVAHNVCNLAKVSGYKINKIYIARFVLYNNILFVHLILLCFIPSYYCLICDCFTLCCKNQTIYLLWKIIVKHLLGI